MKVFLSWSGDASLKVAEALYDWLPDMFPTVEPFMSREIAKGESGRSVIAENLENTHVGIICLTATNLTAPWILFESGALSKSIDQRQVMTYLFDLEPGQISQPLSEFQATIAKNEQDNYRLARTINRALDSNDRRSDERLKRAFNKWWDDLEGKLKQIPDAIPTGDQPKISTEDAVGEILSAIRSMSRHDSVSERTDQRHIAELRVQLERYRCDLKDNIDALEQEQNEHRRTILSQHIERLGLNISNINRQIMELGKLPEDMLDNYDQIGKLSPLLL
ncbi:MAG: hypothetical protein IID44_06905 [Planctomycetes bacterium]|nr:hypothetical protein [Planctomycetota bacterium]